MGSNILDNTVCNLCDMDVLKVRSEMIHKMNERVCHYIYGQFQRHYVLISFKSYNLWK